jgi:hypothetical protein
MRDWFGELNIGNGTVTQAALAVVKNYGVITSR